MNPSKLPRSCRAALRLWLWIIAARSAEIRIHELAAELDCGPSTLRRWLAKLRAAGKINTRQTGRGLIIALNAEADRLEPKPMGRSRRTATPYPKSREKIQSEFPECPQETVDAIVRQFRNRGVEDGEAAGALIRLDGQVSAGLWLRLIDDLVNAHHQRRIA